MTEASFFQNLEQQYDNKLPFVVYSRPINSIIKCWLQKDDVLHETVTFSESGFVFSPFDLEDSAVLLPQSECKHRVLEISNLQIGEIHNSDVKKKSEGQSFHIQLVNKCIAAIENGELEKVVLSRSEEQRVF